MAWIKTTQLDSVNSKPIKYPFITYKEVSTDHDASVSPTSAIPNFIGGKLITGTQTGASDCLDSGTTMYLQASMDGTNWGTVKTATVIALASPYTRGFSFDCAGLYAPYFRVYSPLTTHVTAPTWQICIPN